MAPPYATEETTVGVRPLLLIMTDETIYDEPGEVDAEDGVVVQSVMRASRPPDQAASPLPPRLLCHPGSLSAPPTDSQNLSGVQGGQPAVNRRAGICAVLRHLAR